MTNFQDCAGITLRNLVLLPFCLPIGRLEALRRGHYQDFLSVYSTWEDPLVAVLLNKGPTRARGYCLCGNQQSHVNGIRFSS
jgi:hypothetical protein